MNTWRYTLFFTFILSIINTRKLYKLKALINNNWVLIVGWLMSDNFVALQKTCLFLIHVISFNLQYYSNWKRYHIFFSTYNLSNAPFTTNIWSSVSIWIFLFEAYIDLFNLTPFKYLKLYCNLLLSGNICVFFTEWARGRVDFIT